MAAEKARRGGQLKDGIARTKIYSMRMPADLRDWLEKEAARRTLQGKRTSVADLAIEAMRVMRTRSIWNRHL